MRRYEISNFMVIGTNSMYMSVCRRLYVYRTLFVILGLSLGYLIEKERKRIKNEKDIGK